MNYVGRHSQMRSTVFFGIPLFFLSVVMVLSAGTAHAEENLIPNANFEIVSSNGIHPEGWIRGRWGVNVAEFSYPVTGSDGSRAVEVKLVSRTSGDAKWASAYVDAIPGVRYRYTDSFSSNVETFITVEVKLASGAFSYIDIGKPGATSGWTSGSWEFTAPTGALSMRVFHLINRVGTLSVDNVSLQDVSSPAPTPPPPPPPVSQNVVPNPSLETVGTNGNPLSWLRGRWGVNTALFTYPTTGHTGSVSAKVELTSHTSGDTKWYFSHIPVTPGESYEFSNYYKSDVPSYVNVQLLDSTGKDSYIVLGTAVPSPDWKKFTGTFTVPAGTATLTMFHVIKSVGVLEVDTFSLVKKEIPPPPDPIAFDKGYVSINFDDGWLSVYENALPILDSASFKTDQFIITERMSDRFPGYVSTAQVLDMQARGHRIGAHTRTHPRLAEITEAQAREEIIGSRDDLIAIGATPVNVLAYPEGSYNTAIKNIVREAGFIAARSSNSGQNTKQTDLYALARFNLGNTTTFAQVKSAIDTAMENKSWLILLGHEVNLSARTFAITPALLQEIVNYLKEKNITPILIEEGVAKMGK